MSCRKSQPARLPFHELKCLNPTGAMFCMLTAYMDESYNNRTMSVGGWLCHEKVWPLLEGFSRSNFSRASHVSKKRTLPWPS